jgi:hypothetical protein
MALRAACGVALCALLWSYATFLLPGRSLVAATAGLAGAGVAIICLEAIQLSRRRIILDDWGLTIRGLWRDRAIRWEDVDEVLAPWGLYADPPLILRLDGGGQGGRPRALAVGGGWARPEQLVCEIVARAKAADLNERLRAWITAPNHVPRSRRLAALASLALAVVVTAWALADAFREGVIGILPGALAMATGLPCVLTGTWLGREWRPKLGLIVAYALLALAPLALAMPLVLSGESGWLLVALAAAWGWAIATFAVCFSIRPRVGQVAAGYVAAVGAAVGVTWWFAVREQVPVRRTATFQAFGSLLAWSSEGRRLGVLVVDAAGEGKEYRIFDWRAPGDWHLPTGEVPGQFHLHDPTLVLHDDFLVTRTSAGILRSTRRLWVWDAGSGEQVRLPVPPWLRVAPKGLFSPDGQQVAFLGLPKQGQPWRLYTVRLADLAVKQLPSPVDLSRFYEVRWMPDGRLLLVDQVVRSEKDPARLAFWVLSPESKALTCIYDATALNVRHSFSPDTRWALVSKASGPTTWEPCELLELATGKRRVMDLPGSPKFHEIQWAPDSAAFAYATDETLVVGDPATATLRSLRVAPDGKIRSVALSVGMRFAACTIERARASRIRVVELATHRALDLRRPVLFLPPCDPSWSPAGHTLAVTCHVNPLPPHRTARVYLFDFEKGW